MDRGRGHMDGQTESGGGVGQTERKRIEAVGRTDRERGGGERQMVGYTCMRKVKSAHQFQF